LPLLLWLDEPSADGGQLSRTVRVAGWAAGGSPIVRIEVMCDAAPVGLAELGHPRPDVATRHPNLAQSDRAGFSLAWDTTRLTRGRHTLTVRAVDVLGRVTEIARTVEAEPPLLLDLDELSPDGCPVSGLVRVSGWAAGADPIARVEVACDALPIGVAEIGLLRPDVAAGYPNLAESDRAGFSLLWDTRRLTQGQHTLAVRAVDLNGGLAEVSRTVEVEPPLLLDLDELSPDGSPVSGLVRISGWAAGADPIARVEVACDAVPIGVAEIGLFRPDVAAGYPNLAQADRSGFCLTWDTTRASQGTHTVTVRAVDVKGRVAEWAGIVEVESLVLLDLDQPAPDADRLSGFIKVSGWAAGASPIVRVEVACDGVPVGIAEIGLPRPDVAACHPTLAAVERSGFAMVLEASLLAPGLHELTVQAFDARQRVKRVARQITVPPIRRPGKRPKCKRFALYTSSLGNYFFNEIRDLLAAGLEQLGFVVEIRNERYWYDEDADWHVVIAPHEFFHLGAGRSLLREDVPSHLILLNTEQRSTPWFSLASECFWRAHSIWDINYESSLLIRSRGYACGYLPLGYVHDFAPAGIVEELPEHYGTCFVEPQIRGRAYAGASFGERPIDVMFIGHASRRRDRFFAKAASVFSRYRCYLHFSDVSRPVIPGMTTHMNTATVVGLAQRAKILVNVHHGDDRYFEWHRMVMLGIWQRALVVTEPSGMAPPFRAGVDFVETPLDEMAHTIEYYLSSAEGSRKARETIERGFSTLTESCRLTDTLRQLILDLLNVPEFPERFTTASGEKPGALKEPKSMRAR
jgi:hypothetical protein